MLSLTAELPERLVDSGDVLVDEGSATGSLWVLVEGAFEVRKSGVVVAVVDRPGAVIGEIALLLDAPHGATVTARRTSRVRTAADGAALLRSDPEIGTLVAVGLAQRLSHATTYLADLERQYGDSPGVAMVSTVLGQLAEHAPQPVRSGSRRDPDPDY